MKSEADNYFLDTEFFDPSGDGFSVDFISVGLVSENGGREFYGVYDQIDEKKYEGKWIHEHVVPKLPPQSERISLDRIRAGILQTFKPADNVDIWAKNGSYDFYILARIFGGQLAFRQALREKHGIKKISFCDTAEIIRDLPQNYEIPVQEEATKHIAIDDARHERDAYCAIRPHIPGISIKPDQTLDFT